LSIKQGKVLIIKEFNMKKLSKLVLREHIEQSDFIAKKAQKYILGGSGGGGSLLFVCSCFWGASEFCVGAPTLEHALMSAMHECAGHGATCRWSGNENIDC